MKERNSSITKKIAGAAIVLSGAYFLMKAIAKKKSEGREIDADNPYIDKTELSFSSVTIYEQTFKPIIDKSLAFAGLVILSPLFAAISAAIFIDDPGTIFFTQKRIGKDKRFFCLHKFRSMKMSTPHDVPTHQLRDPEQYITRVGRVLRKTSLDELPQIWDIFRGRMSIIGPRPALWNQEDLVAERQKYGANGVLPGLTGWAQINGRDELEISEKAKLDGEYVRHLKQGGLRALFFDIKCFLGTIKSVAGSDGVVEGGTGSMQDEKNELPLPSIALVANNIAFNEPKKILIAGTGSYVGESFRTYMSQYNNYIVESFDTRDDSWKELDFSQYNVLYDVAGIAHIKETDENKHLYYEVNRDLAVDIAKKAKREGVKHFIYLSSMSVYGVSIGKIDKDTPVKPISAYGKSKLEAERLLWQMNDKNFTVSIVRPPMVYGKGCKGNYQILRKFACKIGVFPEYQNQRSMLYIDNLSSSVRGIVHNDKPGLYFPQNIEYMNIYEMVKTLAEMNGKSFHKIKGVNAAVDIGVKSFGIFKKVFGSLTYEKYLNVPQEWICIKSGKESLIMSEGKKRCSKKTVALLSNEHSWTYNLRKEIIEALLNENYRVVLILPYGEKVELLKDMGCEFVDVPMFERRGKNLLKELRLIAEYDKILRIVRPDVILTFTIKPNLYGGIVARKLNIPYISNITGLGIAVSDKGLIPLLTKKLYNVGLKSASCVFAQNQGNKDFLIHNGIVNPKQVKRITGSGVNLDRFTVKDYPDDEVCRFAFVSRIFKEKGIDEYLKAAEYVKTIYPKTEFHVCGFCEKEYTGNLELMQKKEIIIYHGMIDNVSEFYSKIHCLVHPSYYLEGLSNVCLEACASARPVITTNHEGCREAVADGETGYIVPIKDYKALASKMIEFINLPYDEKKEMGLLARNRMEEMFDRQGIVNAYMEEVRKAEQVHSGSSLCSGGIY